VAYDRSRGLLFIFEPFADGDKPIVHVWSLLGTSAGAPAVSGPLHLLLSGEE
jgi:hypothetical protein